MLFYASVVGLAVWSHLVDVEADGRRVVAGSHRGRHDLFHVGLGEFTAVNEYLRSVDEGPPIDREVLLAAFLDLADELQSFSRNWDATARTWAPKAAAYGYCNYTAPVTCPHRSADLAFDSAVCDVFSKSLNFVRTLATFGRATERM